MVDASVSSANAETPNGSQSITLVMVCAVAGMPIPINYRLDIKRVKGVADHPNWVKKHLAAYRTGVDSKVVRDIKRFAAILKVDSQAVIDGLDKALELGRVAGNINKPTEESRNIKKEVVRGEIPTREEVKQILRSLGGEADEDVFKAAVVVDFAKRGRTLNPNWWEITKRNLIEWSKEG